MREEKLMGKMILKVGLLNLCRAGLVILVSTKIYFTSKMLLPILFSTAPNEKKKKQKVLLLKNS